MNDYFLNNKTSSYICKLLIFKLSLVNIFLNTNNKIHNDYENIFFFFEIFSHLFTFVKKFFPDIYCSVSRIDITLLI